MVTREKVIGRIITVVNKELKKIRAKKINMGEIEIKFRHNNNT